jgi:4-hydroxyphenylpyruvate dioxygenase
MRTAIATVCLSGDLIEKLEASAAAGFRFVEIFENDLLTFNGTNQEVRQRMADLGLTLIAFQPFRDFEGWDEARRDRALARADRKFDAMEELGCDLLMVCSNTSPDAAGGVGRAAEDFHLLGERARKRGFRVAFEALAWGRHINDYRDSWEVVRRADHPNVGLVLDSFHICAKGTDLKPIRSIPGDRIFLVQIADAPRLDMDVMQWSRHFRCFPGQGDLPVDDFMTALGATSYDGPLSLEIFNDQFRAGSARSVAIDGRRSLIYLLDRLGAKAGGSSAQPSDRLPPQSRCNGVAFVEFAADDKGARALGEMFSGMGFAKAGRHVSKDVTRWTQGGINLVINAERDGFAHSYHISHGTSVCAIGLDVESAAATMDRAERLLDRPFRQPVGPGELEIPAVRGLGGSLLYFVDRTSALGRVWDIEFKPATGKATGGADGGGDGVGLTGVDHISQSMQYEEMLSWLLFYSSLLAVEKTKELDIADPGGLVKSQVIQAADGVLRIVLNGSQSSRTQSARFLSEFFGSGVQHIAFNSDDLVTTVQRLVANGVRMLPIPENYYDDLEARADLPPQRLDILRAHNILYDRDEHGEYLQAYSQSFEELFFFEFVERRGYKGFGAINAPIRLAAQARLARHPAVPKR